MMDKSDCGHCGGHRTRISGDGGQTWRCDACQAQYVAVHDPEVWVRVDGDPDAKDGKRMMRTEWQDKVMGRCRSEHFRTTLAAHVAQWRAEGRPVRVSYAAGVQPDPEFPEGDAPEKAPRALAVCEVGKPGRRKG